jgi:hypothetical protein
VRSDWYAYDPKSSTFDIASFLDYYVPVKDKWVSYVSSWGKTDEAFMQWKRIVPTAGGARPGNTYVSGGSFESLYVQHDAEMANLLNLQMGMQFSERYDWYVLIGFEELPKLQIFVDPHGVRKLFEIKYVKDPIEQRKRLIHFVSSYQRKRRPTPAEAEENSEDWIHVCEHLRGCYEFEWRGLNCWLVPSEFDRDRIPAHTKHAEIWK